ncbi:MAG: ABC transporter permease subunit, partial [Gaiellaceae bacterium]
MSEATATLPVGQPTVRIQRWSRISASFTGGATAVMVAFAFVPVLLSQNLTQKLTSLFILAILAAMWNALAGYGGLVSVGQQAFIGIGAYGTVFLADKGVKPYLAMVLAALIAAGISVPISFVVLRFRAAQFAIGMWVVAEAFAILVSLDSSLGAGTGTSLIELNFYSP